MENAVDANIGSDDQSWVATCRSCGVSESGVDAPSQSRA
jgi:hypothetical protein